MQIIHCVTRKAWDACAAASTYGADSLARCGFIHCSEPYTFISVAPGFPAAMDPMLLLCIDTEKVIPEIRWEDGGSGTLYPHIYGELNKDAVTRVLPFLRDKKGDWLPNPEFHMDTL